MFARVRFFKITGYNASTGAPTLDATAIKLYTPGEGEPEVNNRSISLEIDSSSADLEADNRKVTNEVVKGANITLSAYGVDETALSALTEFTKDTNGINRTVNTDNKKHFVLVFNGKKSNGAEYTCYLADTTIKPVLPSSEQDGDSATERSITGYASAITINGHSTLGRRCFKGEAGYLAQNVEPTATEVQALLAK